MVALLLVSLPGWGVLPAGVIEHAFPECFLPGYESREAVQRGMRGLEDAALQAFILESAEHDVVVSVGMARRAGPAMFDTVLVIYRGRLLGVYRLGTVVWAQD